MTSDPGDWVGQGQSYSLATPDATFLTHGDATYYDGNMLVVQVSGPGQWWYLAFQAPTDSSVVLGQTTARPSDGRLRTIFRPEFSGESFIALSDFVDLPGAVLVGYLKAGVQGAASAPPGFPVRRVHT